VVPNKKASGAAEAARASSIQGVIHWMASAMVGQFLDNDGRPLSPGNETPVDHPNQLVGDHTNPILKSDAAEILKTYGELGLSGKAIRQQGPRWQARD